PVDVAADPVPDDGAVEPEDAECAFDPPHAASPSAAAASTDAVTADVSSRRVRLTWLEHDDLRRGLRLDVRLERLNVALDRWERVVVTGNHLARPDQVGRLDRVMPVH